ncbi:MAG: cytochrome c oxidase subunit II [Solirubrobacteraceae bacterium]
MSDSSDLRRPRRTWRISGSVLVGALLLTGCGKQSTVSPRSPQTHQIALLWWWMLGAAAIVFFGAVALLAIAWFKRGSAGLPIFGQREDVSQGLVLVFGIAIPVVVLIPLFAVANLYVIGGTEAPSPSSTPVTIDVIAHQWWWEVRYPGSTAVTANEIHIPVNTRVNLVTTTADVIHSFWVPQLARKIDTVPGHQNRILLEASRAGVYRGQCAEFCGFQHAHMSLLVMAQPAAAYRAWLANMASVARAPASGPARTGAQVFMNSQCASCHQIRGTSAHAFVGPDLTHLATRTTLAAVEIPNDPAYLARWISHPQGIKPGTRMPDLGLSGAQTTALVSYLDSLQ